MGPPPLRYCRAPSPVHFPVEAEVPESLRHLKLRTFLLAILEHSYAALHSIGCDQFVYWNAASAKQCLAPDVFVRLGTPQSSFDSWKTWERGAPELAVEIVSEFDRSETTWQTRLARYHELGVGELVRFDPDAPSGERIRAWDRIEGDLVERVVESDATPCRTLGLWWQVCAALGFPATLRLSEDEQGERPLPTKDEDAAKAQRAAEVELAAARAELARLRQKP